MTMREKIEAITKRLEAEADRAREVKMLDPNYCWDCEGPCKDPLNCKWED